MALLALLFFNGFVLYVVLELGALIFIRSEHVRHIETIGQLLSHYHVYVNMVMVFLIVCGLALLFNSAGGQWLLRFLFGARKPIQREVNKLHPVIERVQQAVKEQLGLKEIKNIKLVIIDDPTPNAMALGKNTLIICRYLYETATEEELAAVIAHEMGHIHNGDSHKLGVAFGVSIVTLTVSWVASAVITLILAIDRMFSEDGKGSGAVGFIALLVWFFTLFINAGNWVLNLAMLFQGRAQEYKADRFAAQAGFKVGLLSFFEKIKDFHMTGRRSLMDRINATHPPVMLRIGKLEEF